MRAHPEPGYFDEGFDLTRPQLYAAALKPFGRARMLPPAAFRSKIFADLEDEKVWTRTWVCIGVQQQIPNAGDLLPFTVGTHGIHVQRLEGGGLIGRFNKAQHGGCRSVPAQCRTGAKTKCSFTSCGYSRDRDVLHAGEAGAGSQLGGQYLGDRPERLLPVKVDTWGPFIFVNLDPECAALAKRLKGLAKQVGPILDGDLMLAAHQWREQGCNWKLAGRALMENLAPPFAAKKSKISTPPARAAKPSHTIRTLDLSPEYEMRFPRLTKLSARLMWSFPNLLLVLMPDHVVSVILQPTATARTLARISLFVDPAGDMKAGAAALAAAWADALGKTAVHAEAHQRTPSRSLERSAAGYDFQKFLVDCILRQHDYYGSAPLYSQAAR
jgi:hypothetical protein